MLPLGANSFLLEQTPFSDGRENDFDKVAFPECVPIPLEYYDAVVHFLRLKKHYRGNVRVCVCGGGGGRGREGVP